MTDDDGDRRLVLEVILALIATAVMAGLIGWWAGSRPSHRETPDPDVCQVFAIAASDQTDPDYPFVIITGTQLGCFHTD